MKCKLILPPPYCLTGVNKFALCRLFFPMLLVSVLLLASCHSDDTPIGPEPGEQQTVTITVSATEEMRTRTVSETEDNALTRCYMQIDDETPVQMTATDNKTFSANTTLSVGESCDFYFWADDGSYTVANLSAVTAGTTTGIAYAGSASWDGSASSVSADLKLVVSKVTLKTTTALSGASVSLTIPATYSGYNVASGSLTGSATSYAHTQTVTTGADGEVFSFYVLTAEGEQDLTLTCGKSMTVSKVPFAPGRHTILSGDLASLATQNVDISADISDSWGKQEIDMDATVVDLSALTGDYTISDDRSYRLTGSTTHAIRINGSPTVTLQNAGINVNSGGNAIDITSGSPTIQVVGNCNVSSNDGAGIYVASGNTVTITGSSRSDKLTTSGGNGAGIGGYVNDSNSGAACGNIIIRNVTVTSYGNYNDRFLDQSAGIGGASRGACGAITIENAAVYAYGTEYVDWAATPAIGSGYPNTGTPTRGIPVVTISGDSEVHAHRGGVIGNADYIGWGGHCEYPTGANNTINLNGGTCTNSIIYCYTGETLDETIKYGADGNPVGQ